MNFSVGYVISFGLAFLVILAGLTYVFQLRERADIAVPDINPTCNGFSRETLEANLQHHLGNGDLLEAARLYDEDVLGESCVGFKPDDLDLTADQKIAIFCSSYYANTRDSDVLAFQRSVEAQGRSCI